MLHSLSAVIGNERLVDLLRRLLSARRLPHAVVLEGIPGCGRRTLATALAATWLCHADGEDACGDCRSCRMLAGDVHPDLSALPHDCEEARIPVDLVRDEVVATAHQSPLAGHGRVYLIPSAERLRPEAANALLKVLEEPPAEVLVVLTTDRAAGLLPTIRSRSQCFRMNPLTPEQLGSVLVAQGLPPDEAARRAALAAGSHRHCRGEHPAEPPFQVLGSLLEDGFDLERIADALEILDAQAADAIGATDAARQRHTLALWCDRLLARLRPRLRERDGLHVAELCDRVAACKGDLALNLQPRLVLERLALDY